jgi:VWFA-related protein
VVGCWFFVDYYSPDFPAIDYVNGAETSQREKLNEKGPMRNSLPTDVRPALVLWVLFGVAGVACAQQPPSAKPKPSSTIHLNVVVTSKSGVPAADLQQQNFTVMDNKSTAAITSFKAVSGDHEPIDVILLLDAVNEGFDTVAFERTKTQEFLRANGGHLAHLTTIAVFTDKGVQMRPNFSLDGNSLADSLGEIKTGLQKFTAAAGTGGASDRLQNSLDALQFLISQTEIYSGRKVVVWLSAGWPLLPETRSNLGLKQKQWIFDRIVKLSTQLREANITLYNINPRGGNENLAAGSFYKQFLQGAKNATDLNYANLGLQVLSIQSGGLVIDSGNDVSGPLKACYADMVPWYEIAFKAASADHPNDYHHIEIKVDKPGLTTRTRDGYYVQP